MYWQRERAGECHLACCCEDIGGAFVESVAGGTLEPSRAASEPEISGECEGGEARGIHGAGEVEFQKVSVGRGHHAVSALGHKIGFGLLDERARTQVCRIPGSEDGKDPGFFIAVTAGNTLAGLFESRCPEPPEWFGDGLRSGIRNPQLRFRSAWLERCVV